MSGCRFVRLGDGVEFLVEGELEQAARSAVAWLIEGFGPFPVAEPLAAHAEDFSDQAVESQSSVLIAEFGGVSEVAVLF